MFKNNCEPVLSPPNNLLNDLPTDVLANAALNCGIVVGCPELILASKYEPGIVDVGIVLPANLKAKSVAANIGLDGAVIV